MDDFTDILEVHGGFGDSEDLHPISEQPDGVGVEDLSLLRLENYEDAEELVKLYSEIDIPREHTELFKHHLLARRDSWFVDVGGIGLVYLTNILPSFTANFNAIFWDRKFGKDRRSLAQQILATGMSEFDLTRVQANIPSSNVVLVDTLPKMGFTKEGVLRNAWRDVNGDIDIVTFSILKREVKWPVIQTLEITSASA